jgi:[ribosomal protein S18]-alanine N-acetyltransferase
MEDRFRIRAAAPADAARIAELERVCFPDPWSPAGIPEVLEANHCLGCVAEHAGTVVGYGIARWVADTGEILNLAVAPEHRRLGLARAILDAILSRLAGKSVQEVYLEVRASNTSAQALYQARGFRLAGMRTAYYRHPIEDALVLRLALTGAA